jgi:hypothetical protein
MPAGTPWRAGCLPRCRDFDLRIESEGPAHDPTTIQLLDAEVVEQIESTRSVL